MEGTSLPSPVRQRGRMIAFVFACVCVVGFLIRESTGGVSYRGAPRLTVEEALLHPLTRSDKKRTQPTVAAATVSALPRPAALLPDADRSAKGFYIIIEKIRAMSDADLYPRLDAPKEIRVRAGAAVCFIAVLGMPHVCGTQRRADIVEACARHWSSKVLEHVLPEKCRDLPYWRDIIAPAYPVADPAGADIGPLTKDGYGEARKKLIDDFCRNLECQRVPDIGHDYVLRSSVAYKRQPLPYVPPANRVFLKDLPVKVCDKSLPVKAYPITFGIVEELIVEAPYADRIWDFFPFVRLFDLSKWDPYKMGERDEYMSNEVYRRSYFGLTHRRGGWDCFRHYEILAAGSLPYFPDLALCDKVCLATLPKALLEEAMTLPGVSWIGRVEGPHLYTNASLVPASKEYLVLAPEVKFPTNVNFRKAPHINFTEFDRGKYDDLVHRTLDYTRKYLTTKSIVSYLLHRIGVEEPKHVLLIARDLTDYMEMTVEHGLASLGIKYTTNQERPHGHQRLMGEFDPEPSAASMDEYRTHTAQLWRYHGRGMGYGIRIPPLPADHNSTEAFITSMIASKSFDLVIYSYLGLPIEHQPYFKALQESQFPKERMVIVCGNDNLNGFDWSVEMFHANRLVGHLFRRELFDYECK